MFGLPLTHMNFRQLRMAARYVGTVTDLDMSKSDLITAIEA